MSGGKGMEASIRAVLTDEGLRRREFPVTERAAFLAHAASAPLPARVAAAIGEYARRATEDGQFEHLHREAEDESRALAANLLGASADEIGFIPSTSAGLSAVAAGMDWNPGDSVVIADGDFPSNVYPWLNLERLGVRVNRIPRKPEGAIEPADVEAALDARTRLVSLSSVQFSTGAAIDVDAIGAMLHGRGVQFCLDAIQSLGALPCSVQHVDYLAADAHKWLLGPQGIGIFYVRRERFKDLHPVTVGWKSVRAGRDFRRVELDFHDSARRYESGNLNALGVVGLRAALTLITEASVPFIAERLRSLRAMLVSGLMARGCEVLGASNRTPTGITCFRHPGVDSPALYKRLDEARVIVSMRDDLTGRPCIRVAPHFYTSDADIQRLFDLL